MFLLLLGLWQSCGLGRVGVGRSEEQLEEIGWEEKGKWGYWGEKVSICKGMKRSSWEASA